ncbi:hypothetical protein [Burkholderia anthina]|uniref:hypothetical protein n=1 Tax=Burkholderia anthina TaxID=179879 RepID=UPI00158C0383|nr:hypothetical protein [Burkholderia anthina]
MSADKILVDVMTDEKIEAWADGIVRKQAFNRSVAVEIAIAAAKWARETLAASTVERTTSTLIPADECAQDVYDHGQSIGLFDIPKKTANSICAGITEVTGARVDWHYFAGRVHMKALAAAPAASADETGKQGAKRDARQLADWLLTDPQTGEKLHFAGTLERDFLGLSRVKMQSATGDVWTLTAGLQEGYLTATERMANIRAAATEETDDASAQAAEPAALPQAVLDALRFYANGHHFNIDEDHQQFDTVSGEPTNWLFSERDDDCSMIEDGSIARAALCGGQLGFEDPETPIEGEVFAAAQPPAQADQVAHDRKLVGVREGLTAGMCETIDAMIELTRVTLIALDDSEEQEGPDGCQHAINSANFDEINNALERLEGLPDDKPGETLNAAGKARWALRAILDGHRFQPKPLDMLLFCPKCGEQHFDKEEWVRDPHDIEQGQMRVWGNPPHRSHLCHACETIWRPADVPTNGVAAIQTSGKNDTWHGRPGPRAEVADTVLVPARAVELLELIKRDGILKRASELQEVYRLVDAARAGESK